MALDAIPDDRNLRIPARCRLRNIALSRLVLPCFISPVYIRLIIFSTTLRFHCVKSPLMMCSLASETSLR